MIRIAKEAGATVVVDNTWLTPCLLQPARLGADLVIHSVTKYTGGHGNARGGVVTGKKNLVGKVENAQCWLGGLLRPMRRTLSRWESSPPESGRLCRGFFRATLTTPSDRGSS